MKSAVEMTPVESVENSKSEFPTLSTGLEIRPKTKAPDFHISTAPAAALYHHKRTKMNPKTNSS
jgi:hypothetical protein